MGKTLALRKGSPPKINKGSIIGTINIICIFYCCSNVTGEAELQLDVPDSITTWVTEAIGLSEEKGLGLAQRAELRTFKPFFVDFTLPYSVIRGEQTKVPLTVYNYLPSCAEVRESESRCQRGRKAVEKGLKPLT